MRIRTVSGLLALIPFFMSGAAADYGKLPLSFEPNRGQTDARVQFVARGAGYAIFLSPASATFALQSSVVRMDLLGAAAGITLQAEDKLPGVANYLMGSTRAKWTANLPLFAKIRSRNVYPGIDLVYYGTQGQLEYDFVLAPHADASRIRLGFEGAAPRIDDSGDLILPFGENNIRFHKPVIYQQVKGRSHPVNGRFAVDAEQHEVRFEVGSYDHSRELVIDPVLVYSSYLGGSSQQSVINAMAVDAAGAIYVTGITNALDYPTTPGVIERNCPGSNGTFDTKCGPSSASAAFVSKISADGQSLIYSTYLGGGGSGPGVGGSSVGAGGSGNDLGTGIAVDAGGNAWVVGQTNSNNFPITADAYSLFCEPAAQGFNFNTEQNFGEVNGCGGPNASGYFYSGTYSLFLVKLNPTGTSILYGTFLGGTAGELAAQIALDAAGSIYIAGTAYTGQTGTFAATGQYNYPTTASAYQTKALLNGQFSAFATKFSPDGKTLLYSTMLGGPNNNTYNSALAIGGGKIFIGGYTQDPHLPTTAGALSSTCPGAPTAAGPDTICAGGANNGYVAEFDPTKSGAASLVFSTYLNGSTAGNASTVNALAADAAGNVYAAGYDGYPDFPTTPGVLQPTCNSGRGGCDTGFVTKLSAAGALVWSTFYGSPSTDGGNQTVSVIAVDGSSNVYIAANATGLGDYPLKNGFQDYAGGAAYIAELSSSGSQVLFGSYYGGANNVFPTGLVVDAAGNIYFSGYTAGNLPLVNALQSTAGGGYNEGFIAKIGAPSITSVTNAEGDGPTIAPNTWVAIKGSGFAAVGDARIWLAADFVNNQMPVQLDGTSVTMNGESAYVYYISPTQINILTPPDLAPGPVQVKVTSGGVVTGAFTAQAQAYSLSMFVFGGGPYVLGTHLNGTDLGPASLYPGLTTPAQPGELVVLYANGFGPTSTNVVAGASAQSGMLPVLPVVQIGGNNAVVQFAGLVSPGLYQFNVQIPASTPNGDIPITVQYNGLSVQSGLRITVQQ